MSISNFYPVTPEVARILRGAKLTAAEWRVWSYLIEIDPWGDVYKDIDTLTVMAECDVSRPTYYRAIAKFKELELFDIQDKGISIRNLAGASSLKNETKKSKVRQNSQNCETRLKNETKKSKVRQNSQNCEKQSSKPLSNKTSDAPQTNKTYSDFINTLSEGEREEFLKFAEQKVAQLPHPPTFPRRLIEENWQELSGQWYKSAGKTPPAQNSKWENDPRTRDWLAIIEETANPLEFAVGDPEKFDFVRWAKETKQFSWLRKES